MLVMQMDKLNKRKTPRYQSFDYNSVGVYFITICTHNRRCILSRIVGTGVPDRPHIELTKYGAIADKYIKQFNEFYAHLSVENYVIMPNHIHILLWVKENKNTSENTHKTDVVPYLRTVGTGVLDRPQAESYSSFALDEGKYTPENGHKTDVIPYLRTVGTGENA